MFVRMLISCRFVYTIVVGFWLMVAQIPNIKIKTQYFIYSDKKKNLTVKTSDMQNPCVSKLIIIHPHSMTTESY